jgi:hypothetical protein
VTAAPRRAVRAARAAAVVWVAPALAACATGRRAPAPTPAPAAAVAPPPDAPRPPGPAAAVPLEPSALAYAGAGRDGRPRYVGDVLPPEDRAAMLQAFGVDDPSRLYLPDSSPGAILRYDLRTPAPLPLGSEHQLTVRVGYPSARRRGESWDAFAARVLRTPAAAFSPAARTVTARLDALDADARVGFTALLADARRAGFAVRVTETWRSAERQAWLLARGRGRTLTLTSAHMTGRAADVVVGDGNLRRAATRRRWVAFRRWAQAYGGGNRFRIIGTPERTWDWPHVELADDPHGFRSVDDALAAAHDCAGDLAPDGDGPCLPAAVAAAARGGAAAAGAEARPGRPPNGTPDGARAARARPARPGRRIE